MNTKALGLAGLAVCFLAQPANAHHSFAMFDITKTVEYQGTVKELEWTNPHSWLVVMVPNAQGEMVEWALETNSPGKLARNGWRARIVVPGDKVTVELHPLKNGESGGQLVSVVLPNGTKLGGD